jgi:prolyl oligopeptidase
MGTLDAARPVSARCRRRNSPGQSTVKTTTLCAAGLAALLASAGYCGQLSAVSTAPPPTPLHDVVDTYHGRQVHDPYRWLEQAEAPAVKEWIDAQNGYTDAVMTRFAGAPALVKRVGELALTSTQRSSPEIAGSTLFYLRETPPQPQAVLVAEGWPRGESKVLVDTNAANGNVAIVDFWPSPDGRRVAYGTAEGGTENTTIHFVDAADGKVAADALPYAGGGTTPQALAWDGDGKGVTYVRLPLPGTAPADRLQFNAVLYHHVFGAPASADTAVLGKGFSPVAEYLLLSSTHGESAAALVHYGDGNSEAVYLRKDREWRKALGTEARVDAGASMGNGAAWDGERLLLVSHQDAPRGKLLALERDGSARVLLAQQEWAMEGVAPIKGGFLIREVSGPDWRVRQFTAEGRLVRTLPLPQSGVGIGLIASSADSPEALISYSGWALPTHWAKYDGTTGTLTTVFEVKSPADYSAVRGYRLTAKSADGTAVPVTVVALAGVKPDGARPAILSAYGGYGLSQPPRFMGTMLAWLERGGVYALANIRGGGEYGEGWHEGGRLANKQHCFDDFHAAAQALVSAHWTDVAHLGILGGSNGGLLMGAALTQHPADYRAVVSFVGVYDMLRAELWPNGEYNISEYGTVRNAADFAWLYAYSPLQHVRPGTAYPAVLLITGENDPRVAPWQSRKFAAALQKANSSPQPILLLTRRNEGHGVTSTFSQRVGNSGAMLAFFAQQLDLPAGPASKPAGPAPK